MRSKWTTSTQSSIVHPNSLALPVALALAEADPSLSGRDIVTALILGYEVGLRIGNAATTSLFLNGFHPQGTSGAFVAAATAGRLLALDPAQMQHALGIAGSMGAGLMAAQEGAMVKRLHAGRAAQGGMLAALLAKRGFTGISDVVEAGYGGFLSSFSRTPNVRRLVEGLGEDWEAGKVGFKMYPNVTSIHSALDALRSILVKESLAASRIKEINVGCGHMTFVHTAWEYRPAGTTAAQMNMYYGLSVMALRGDVSALDYSEDTIADPEILAFIPRIKIAVDPEIESRGPSFRHAARNRGVDDRRAGIHARNPSPSRQPGESDQPRRGRAEIRCECKPTTRAERSGSTEISCIQARCLAERQGDHRYSCISARQNGFIGRALSNSRRTGQSTLALANVEGKGAIKWTRLSCRTFTANAVRLQLHALAYNLDNVLRTLATPEPIKDWSLTSLKDKLIKIGAKVVSHGRYVAFQLAEVAIPRQMFQEILRLIAELRPQPLPAPA